MPIAFACRLHAHAQSHGKTASTANSTAKKQRNHRDGCGSRRSHIRLQIHTCRKRKTSGIQTERGFRMPITLEFAPLIATLTLSGARGQVHRGNVQVVWGRKTRQGSRCRVRHRRHITLPRQEAVRQRGDGHHLVAEAGRACDGARQGEGVVQRQLQVESRPRSDRWFECTQVAV